MMTALSACAAESAPPAAPVAPAPPPAPIATAEPTPPPPVSAPPAANDEFAKVEIKVQRVAGNVYMLQGSGGNIGVLTGDDGTVIVDDEFAPLAPKIRAALRGISDKPIKFVINTHWHGDHTGGNVVFGAEGTIVAQENVRKRLIAGRPPFKVGNHSQEATPPAPPVALPVVTFDSDVALHFDGEDVRAIHFPSGHTDGDSVIYFTKAHVVHMGDDFVTYGYPFVDAGSGGSVRGMIAAVDKAIALLPADVKVIPGHGDLCTIDDVKKYSAMLKDVVHLVEVEVKKNKTVEQAVADKPLAKYEAAGLGKGGLSSDDFVAQVYTELKTRPEKAPHPAPASGGLNDTF